MPNELTNEREKTHGDFSEVAGICQDTLGVWRSSRNWEKLTYVKRQALEVIAQKVSRALCGDHDEPDHWKDIGGYAQLVVDRLKEKMNGPNPPLHTRRDTQTAQELQKGSGFGEAGTPPDLSLGRG